MQKHFICVLFTASAEQYAKLILGQMMKKLEPGNLKAFFYRDSCSILKPTQTLLARSQGKRSELFIKDLSIFDKPLSDVILVDNSSSSFALQPYNGIPIISFQGDKADKELYEL